MVLKFSPLIWPCYGDIMLKSQIGCKTTEKWAVKVLSAVLGHPVWSLVLTCFWSCLDVCISDAGVGARRGILICSNCPHHWCQHCCHGGGHVSWAEYTCPQDTRDPWLMTRGGEWCSCVTTDLQEPGVVERRRVRCRIRAARSTPHTLVCSPPSEQDSLYIEV